MRAVRRLCLLASAALAGTAFLLPSSARSATLGFAPPPPGSVFAGVAVASAVHQQFDAVGGGISVVSEPVYDNVPDALTEFNGDSPLARASTFYPGGTFANLFPFACGQVIEGNFAPLSPILCHPPPGYPLMAQAPTLSGSVDAATPGTQQVSAGPVDLTAVSATAHADHRYTDASAIDGGFATTGAGGSTAAAVLAFRQAIAAVQGPAAAVAVTPAASDSSMATSATESASSHQSWNTGGQLVVTAAATDHGVSLLGGAIKISSVTVTSTYVTDGGSLKKHTQDVAVSGVMAGGMPATIDQNGITVNGSGSGKAEIDAVNAALQQLLAATSTHIRLLTPSNSSKPGQVPAGLNSPAYGAFCSSGEADGVQLYQQLDASKVPAGQVFFESVTFGSACTDATVFPTAPSVAVPAVSIPPLTAPGGPGVASSAGGSSGPVSSGGGTFPTGPSSSAGPLAAGPPATPSRSGGGGGIISRLEADLAGHGITGRFSLLYLAFVVAAVGLLLGALPLLRPRFPRGY